MPKADAVAAMPLGAQPRRPHPYPRSCGGTSHVENLQVLGSAHNSKECLR